MSTFRPLDRSGSRFDQVPDAPKEFVDGNEDDLYEPYDAVAAEAELEEMYRECRRLDDIGFPDLFLDEVKSRGPTMPCGGSLC